MKPSIQSRRSFLRSALGATTLGATALLTSGLTPRLARAGFLPPTEGQTEGPFYRAGAPFRNVMVEEGEPGSPLLVYGYIVAPDVTLLGGALLDVWHADNAGAYDNTSPAYRGRGRQMADENGFFWFYTIWPGYYPGRTKHLHFKASAPGYRLVTSQLYFRDDPRNPSDGLYRQSLELDWFEWKQGITAAYFPIVLARA